MLSDIKLYRKGTFYQTLSSSNLNIVNTDTFLAKKAKKQFSLIPTRRPHEQTFLKMDCP